jgi:hypothetical protein
MKIAFYYLSVGEDAAKCLEHSHKSLREVGWKGDVVILCDRQSDLPGLQHENTKQYIVKPELLNLDTSESAPPALIDIRNYDNKDPYKFSITYLTPFIDDYVDITQWDYIVFLDIDILFVEPLDTLFEILKGSSRPFYVASNRRKIRGNTPCSANLTPEELEKYGDQQGLCSNFLCFPGSSLSKEMLAGWRKECFRGLHSDQAALQALFLREYPEQFDLAPFSILGYAPGWKEYQKDPSSLKKLDSLMVHFQGAIRHPEALLEYRDKYMCAVGT